MKKRKIYTLMVLATLFWSGAFIAGKYTVPFIPTFTLTFLRFFFAAIVLYGLMRITNHPYRLKKADIPVFILTGTIGMFGYHVLFFSCLKYTTAINSSIIGAMNPIITVILAFFLLGQRLSRKQVFGVALSFIGVFLTITGADIDIIRQLDFNKGDLIMLCATFSWAVYSIISSKATKPVIPSGINEQHNSDSSLDLSKSAYTGREWIIDKLFGKRHEGQAITPLALTYYSFIVCLIELIPFVILEQPQTFIFDLSPAVWASVLYMSIFPSVIGYQVQQMSIKEIGPSRTSIFINLVPVFSIILAVVILDEVLYPIKLLTAALIITGVVITQKEKI